MDKEIMFTLMDIDNILDETSDLDDHPHIREELEYSFQEEYRFWVTINKVQKVFFLKVKKQKDKNKTQIFLQRSYETYDMKGRNVYKSLENIKQKNEIEAMFEQKTSYYNEIIEEMIKEKIKKNPSIRLRYLMEDYKISFNGKYIEKEDIEKV